jgi:hypothetical protein
LRKAWKLDDHDRALADLHQLAGELERSHPGAASSREGMAETLTLTRLGIKGKLKATLESTNPCESMIECVRRSSRNVKRWQSGDMALRWTAAGMLEAQQQFRRIIGYTDLAKLVAAIDHDLTRRPPPPRPARRPYARHRQLITTGPPSRSSTTNGTSSLASRRVRQPAGSVVPSLSSARYSS